MSEAEYLDSIHPYTEVYATYSRRLTDRTIPIMKALYKLTENTKKGDMITCPYCGTKFTKKTYQQKFCCTQHKDKYWNVVNPRGMFANN